MNFLYVFILVILSYNMDFKGFGQNALLFVLIALIVATGISWYSSFSYKITYGFFLFPFPNTRGPIWINLEIASTLLLNLSCVGFFLVKFIIALNNSTRKKQVLFLFGLLLSVAYLFVVIFSPELITFWI